MKIWKITVIPQIPSALRTPPPPNLLSPITSGLLLLPQVLPLLGLHMTGTMQCVAHCVCLLLLSIMLVRSVPVAVCNTSLFLFIANQFSIVGIDNVFLY